ncbi:hypothetical protein AB8S08_02655 [Pseudidiomarina sp. PP-1MA]|uniref:HPr kinase n=1 Tax=Pseudidiomarina sp. PP-1MA TaxID=3237706 RepID=A0AB39X8E9_9GAMM
MSYLYQIYGVVLASELKLSGPLTVSEKVADIYVRLADVPEDPPKELEIGAAFAAIGRTQFWLDVPHVARFFATDLATIDVQPYANSDAESIELFLLGSVLGPLLNMRKHLVMHGNVVHLHIDDQRFRTLICGYSAAGKSSFAAHLIKHHKARLVADDLAVFDEHGNVLPGSPRLKVWKDVALALELDQSELSAIRPQVEKYDWQLTGAFSAEPQPIDLIVILNSDSDGDLKVNSINGANKLLPLQRQIFRKKFANLAGLERLQFMLVAKHCGNVPVLQLARPRSKEISKNLHEMSERLFNYLLGNHAEAVNE